MARVKILLAIGLLMAGAVALSLVSPRPTTANFSQATPSMFPFAASSHRQLHVEYGQLPMSFEPNVGQTDGRVKFMARGSKFGLFLTEQQAVLKVGRSSALQMSLAGGNPNPEIAGADALPGNSNYLTGNDPSRWHRNIPQFARVRYAQVYPGVDLVYYGKQGQLEYDFELAPGADLAQIGLKFQGVDKLSLDRNGDLVLSMNGGEMRLEAPRVYQTWNGAQNPVEGKFVLQANQQVRFEVGAYDRNRALVIDPVLSYSTYLGGSGDELAPSITVDSAFNAYVVGTTTSADFPIVPATSSTSYQNCLNDSAQPTPALGSCPSGGTASDVFIAKLDPSGSALVFSTYLGGSGDDSAAGVAIDSGFNIIVAGTTKSGDFPVMNAFQTTQGSSTGQHVFVSELDPVGQKLLYSTYLRGGATETASGVAVDPRNKIFITGTTTSTDFPVTSDAFQSASRAANQFFVSKIDPARSSTASLAYSTYFGGGNPSTGAVAGGGIAVDKNNAVYFTGATNFLHTGGDPASDFPILNASQGCLDSPGNPSPCPTTVTNLDAFVAKLDPTKPIGSHLIYSTYFGGAGNDSGTGIAVDSGGVVYLTGTTDSPNLPIPSSTTPFQQCLGAGTTANPGTAGCPSGSANNDAFLAKFSNFTTGTTTTPNVTVLYFTYVGGSNDDQGLAIATNGAQGASITGSTNSADFPGVNNSALQTALAGARDAFLTQIDTTATTQTTANEISTFLGGSGSDRGTSIALDSGGSTFIAGETASADFPHVNAFQGALSGSSVDAFVSKFSSVGKFSITTTPVPTPNPVGVGATVTFTFNIVNNGDFVPSITVQIHPQANGQNASATASNGQCGQASGSPPAITCTLVPSAGTAAGTVTLTVAPPSNASGSTPGTPYSFGASANVVSPGTASANASVTVNDYALSLTPNSATVVAGSAATYTAQVTPTGSIPGSVSLSCTGLPTSASCSVANGSITSLTTGPQSRAIVVNTTARTTTTVELRRQGPLYAVWLPVSGLAFLGLGIGGTMSRKRRALLGFLAGAFSVLIFLQAGCGSKSSGTTTTTGTPAGTYTFTVTASSGTGASHSQLAQLTVQ